MSTGSNSEGQEMCKLCNYELTFVNKLGLLGKFTVLVFYLYVEVHMAKSKFCEQMLLHEDISTENKQPTDTCQIKSYQ